MSFTSITTTKTLHNTTETLYTVTLTMKKINFYCAALLFIVTVVYLLQSENKIHTTLQQPESSANQPKLKKVTEKPYAELSDGRRQEFTEVTNQTLDFFDNEYGLPFSVDQLTTFSEWAEIRGYHIVEAFEGDRAFHPYADVSKELLLELAVDEDPVAQFITGLHLLKEKKAKEAEGWLKKAIVTGGFSAPITYLSNIYFERSMNMEIDLNKRQDYKKQAMIWALVGVKRNDFPSKDELNILGFEQLDEVTQKSLISQSELLADELQNSRLMLGGDEFQTNALPNDIMSILDFETNEVEDN